MMARLYQLWSAGLTSTVIENEGSDEIWGDHLGIGWDFGSLQVNQQRDPCWAEEIHRLIDRSGSRPPTSGWVGMVLTDWRPRQAALHKVQRSTCSPSDRCCCPEPPCACAAS